MDIEILKLRFSCVAMARRWPLGAIGTASAAYQNFQVVRASVILALPREVGARPKTAPLNQGLTLLGARPASSGSSATGASLSTGKLLPHRRRKRRKTRTAPGDLNRSASIKSLGPHAHESMSDEMLRKMRFDRMVEPIRPAFPGASVSFALTPNNHKSHLQAGCSMARLFS